VILSITIKLELRVNRYLLHHCKSLRLIVTEFRAALSLYSMVQSRQSSIPGTSAVVTRPNVIDIRHARLALALS
jgi:hypothetical protein